MPHFFITIPLCSHSPPVLICPCPYCRDVDIEQEINTSRGDIAYTVVDIGSIDIDPAGLQVGGGR